MNKKKILIIVAIAAVVLAGVMVLLIVLPKGGADNGSATLDETAEPILTTDKDGVHQAEVPRDEKGEPAKNSKGALVEYVPADISSIHIENSKGSFDVLSETPEGEATVYTIKGYEDFEIQSGIPDSIASSASSLSYEKVAGVDADGSSDFGFDNPRSVVTVTYTDKTKAVITVGSDAPQAAGTYIKFGDGDEVYVISSETAEPFDYGLTDLISLTINSSAESADDGIASSIKVTCGGESISLVPYSGSRYSSSYEMTSPKKRLANEGESSKIEGGIRGLYALSVVMVNPSGNQLSKLGLSSPNASVSAVYPDTEVNLVASKPDSDGNVNLMEKGGKVVYSIAADKVPWVSTSYAKLCGEYVLLPKMTALSGMTVDNGSKYTFSLSSRESVTTDNDGNETSTTVTSVFNGDEEIQLGDFSTYFDTVSLIGLADSDEEKASGKPALTITYTYSEDGGTDTVEFYSSGGNRYVASLNGEVIGHATKADVTRAIKDAASVIEG